MEALINQKGAAMADDKNDVGEALHSLVRDESARSEMARLRDIFDDVEAALTRGVRRAAVLDTLHEKGFTMTMASFKSALQRIRAERK